jgi:predicted ribosome quality control (RQC) complex YloA/Tae2 family protein
MAFDGVTIACIREELEQLLVGGRIQKIAQPEKDELIITVKNNSSQYRLLVSVDPSLPLVYITETNKQSPMTAPAFCMLMRKHLQGAKIISITQPGLERILDFQVEHYNELGDLCTKHIIIELMGKHSNLIFVDHNKRIIDSIKHVSQMVSSVREVLPGREYFIPQTQQKEELFTLTETVFFERLIQQETTVQQNLYQIITGISPSLAKVLCYEADIDANTYFSLLSDQSKQALWQAVSSLKNKLLKKEYQPAILYENGIPVDYYVIESSFYDGKDTVKYESIQKLLEQFYALRNQIIRIKQKSTDLRRIVHTALERNLKKAELQEKQLLDTEKKEQFRVYGELLHTYGYEAKPQDKEIKVLNYYNQEELIIPLDPMLTAAENAKKYFDKYNKMKRTYEALSQYIKETKEEIAHLESVESALNMALMEEDLLQIKEELIQEGYIKRKNVKREKVTSKPYHFLSTDGFHIYAGKNNYQNEDLTFQFATGNDWWFHAKNIPGSHVILKSEGKVIPDKTFEEAATLAAYFSKARGNEKVEVDYVEKKHVKKPSGAKPGFVVYYTNYSMICDSNISKIEQVDKNKKE